MRFARSFRLEPNATYILLARIGGFALGAAKILRHLMQEIPTCWYFLRKLTQKYYLLCMFYQFLCVLHSRSSTQSWGSVLPSIVETRDQNSRGCPLLFPNRNLGSFCALGTEILYTHSLWEVVDHSRSKMHATCLIIIHNRMTQGK